MRLQSLDGPADRRRPAVSAATGTVTLDLARPVTARTWPGSNTRTGRRDRPGVVATYFDEHLIGALGGDEAHVDDHAERPRARRLHRGGRRVVQARRRELDPPASSAKNSRRVDPSRCGGRRSSSDVSRRGWARSARARRPGDRDADRAGRIEPRQRRRPVERPGQRRRRAPWPQPESAGHRHRPAAVRHGPGTPTAFSSTA